MQPVNDDRTAWRNAPWGGEGEGEDWIFLGQNLVGHDFRMDIRTAPGNRLAVLVSLDTIASPTATGITTEWDAAYPDPETGAIVGATIVTPLVLDTDLEPLPWPTERDQPAEFHYDLTRTPPGGLERVEAYGKFILQPGVTIA